MYAPTADVGGWYGRRRLKSTSVVVGTCFQVAIEYSQSSGTGALRDSGNDMVGVIDRRDVEGIEDVVGGEAMVVVTKEEAGGTTGV